ncbi:ABC transporter substrate-binding protein [Jannaschia sp. Os4]|uniref:ABC transporter substrate-binding protein n=1 Tax=Jannaschia sp. Os4 TaxID=2807617 RepID=UPI00193A5B70|nr:ABC transporter substrate-binding protein [Jannaschia sp. Os4]MBM2576359.1 ABC transporter substrate-binding protein [Jannaschia sp. Os4]
MRRPLRIAHLPLVDAAPLVVARDLGLAEAEGLTLELVAAPSWSALRDMLGTGQAEAAQMLSPMPVAMALGLGGVPGAVEALQVLSVNGDVIGVSPALAARMGPVRFGDAGGAGAALLAAARRAPVRIGVPFPFSMHAELVHYLLERCGPPAPGEIVIRTVPPPLMADALGAGEVDAFCVGEPWGSDAVERGAGALILPGRAIWAFSPEKVLAARTGWAEAQPARASALMRALHRAARWLSAPANLPLAAEMMARDGALGLSVEMVEPALTGRLRAGSSGEAHVPGFLEFHAGAAAFPWRSQGAWIADRLARRHGLDRKAAQAAGRRVFRSDLYRRLVGDLAADMPGASSKVEGALAVPTAVASRRGMLTLRPDAFFDGRVFEPLPGE